jgi:hypothetical protein
MSFFDPGWMCSASIPWSGGFASNTTDIEFHKRQEVSRGAALLHTRATHDNFDERTYLPTSYAGRLYGKAAARVARNISGAPLGPLGPRTLEQEEAFRTHTARNSIADPPTLFIPPGRSIQLKQNDTQCLLWVAQKGNPGMSRSPGQCSQRNFHSVWVHSVLNYTASGYTSGFYIRSGNWRINKCLRAHGKKTQLAVEMQACWPPKLQKGPEGGKWQLWRIGEDGTLRSTVDRFKSCLRMNENRDLQMGPCGGEEAFKFHLSGVPDQIVAILEHTATESQFPAALRHKFSGGANHT